jgi:hypothetical protein
MLPDQMPADLRDGPEVFQNAAQRATSIGEVGRTRAIFFRPASAASILGLIAIAKALARAGVQVAVNRLAILALTQFWCSSDYSAPINLA